MKSTAQLSFIDADSKDQACITVRFDESVVGLGISLKSNGDIEAFMPKDIAAKLIERLQNAISEAP